MMGDMVEFPSNGTQGQGYLAVPAGDSGPGVAVFQEWWGLNAQIKGVCDALAGAGLVALAPDLYRGVETAEPDEAAKMMMALNMEQAAKDMVGAVDFLAAHPAVRGKGLGVTGFCMGGGLALLLATMRPDVVKACVPFYGVIPWPAHQPDYSKLAAAVQGHYAEKDEFANAEAVAALEGELKGLGKSVEVFVYADTDHAFTNETRPEVYDAAATRQAMERAVAFLHTHLDP